MDKNYTIDDRPDSHPEVIKRREELLNSLPEEKKKEIEDKFQELIRKQQTT